MLYAVRECKVVIVQSSFNCPANKKTYLRDTMHVHSNAHTHTTHTPTSLIEQSIPNKVPGSFIITSALQKFRDGDNRAHTLNEKNGKILKGEITGRGFNRSKSNKIAH